MKIGTGVSEGQKELDDDKLRWLFFFFVSQCRGPKIQLNRFPHLESKANGDYRKSQQPALELRCSLAAVMLL